MTLSPLIQVKNQGLFVDDVCLIKSEIKSHAISATHLAVLSQERLTVFSLPEKQQLVSIDCPSGLECRLSAKHLILLNKYVASESAPPPNLHIYAVDNLIAPIHSFVQKSPSFSLQFSPDDALFARLYNSHLSLFRTGLTAAISNIPAEPSSCFAISPKSLVLFVPEKKDNPAFVKLFDLLPINQGEDTIPDFKPTSQKSFFRADSASFYFSPSHTSVLVLTHTDVDKTGASYYGETSVYFLSLSGKHDCSVQLSKKGPIHDVTFCKDGFLVLYGSMPANLTLFDMRANPIYEFPSNPRNALFISPSLDVLLVAGFGNLTGSLDIFNMRTKTLITSVKAENTSTCHWSPCGLYFFTSTIYKRLKVDNGVKIWHWSGRVLKHEKSEQLFSVNWLPIVYEKGTLPNFEDNKAPDGMTVDIVAESPKKAGVYRPPGARGLATPSIYTNRDTLPVGSSKSVPGTRNVPGTRPKTAGNNKNGAVPPPPTVPDVNPEEAREKKVKSLQKKLKQISDLKERKKGGEMLELTQLSKIEGEEKIKQELRALGVSV